MSIKVSGFIARIDYSDKFGNFTPTMYTYGKNTHLFNPDTSKYVDFEIVSLNRIGSNDRHDYSPLPESDLFVVSDIVNWLYNSANGDLTANVDDTNSRLMELFGTAFVSVAADEMIVDKHNNILPNQIRIDISRDNSVNSYTYWMCSSNFFNEYPDHDATIFIPTTTVDGLMTSKDNLQQIINATTLDDYNTNINTAGTESPYTTVYSLPTMWVSRSDPSETLEIRFTFACYGPISNDVGIMKQVLREYILDNTDITESVWEHVLPEIFTATTFMMIPAWDLISGGLSSAPIYNPLARIADGIEFYTTHLTGFTNEHTISHLESLPILWQSLNIAVCASTNNPSGANLLRNHLPDYMLVSYLEGGDFIRLKAATKDFIIKINNYMSVIESYRPGDVIKDLTIEVIDNLTFVVFTSFSVKCKVLCKHDYMKITERV